MIYLRSEMSTNDHTVFWIIEKNGRKLATLNNSKENKYRIWKPYRSKLGAAIINGLEIFPILKKSKMLYLDTFMENTINHISDIIGIDGKIFVPKNYTTSFLEKIKNTTTNISFITDIKKSVMESVDVLYLDVPNQNFFDIVSNYKIYLKNDGYLMLVIKTNEIFENQDSGVQENNMYKKIQSFFNIIQEVNLANFFSGQTMVIAKHYDS